MSKISRNESCPCGSGKKYKHCCGALTASPAHVPSAERQSPEVPVAASAEERQAKAARIAAGAAPRLDSIDQGDRRPFWTVIVPLYDRTDFLNQCLASVLDQGLHAGDMEILVVDDASPTDLRQFVEGLGRGRVAYVRNPVNLGLYQSTNAALRRSRGRWIHILHDDDWVLPGFYATMRAGIENASASTGVAFCMYVSSNERNGTTWSPPPFRTGAGTMPRDFLSRLATGNPLNLSAVVYRRDTFERVGLFREDLPFTADWEWYVRSAVSVDWHFQPETLAYFRMHARNQTLDLARVGQAARDIRHTLDIFENDLPRDLAMQVLPAARRFHARQHLAGAFRELQAGNRELAMNYLSEAAALDRGLPQRAEFVQLVQHPAAAGIRNEVSKLLREGRAN